MAFVMTRLIEWSKLRIVQMDGGEKRDKLKVIEWDVEGKKESRRNGHPCVAH